MGKPEVNPRKIAVFTGSGISAASGIPMFRFGVDALWANHLVEEVATVEALERNPVKVIQFFNDRKEDMKDAAPTEAHIAIAKLEQKFDVVVITTNIDNLHEKAGSTNVIHVHGNAFKARSSIDPELVYDLGDLPIHIGDCCAHGEQLRPDVVLFGEDVHLKNKAQSELKDASKVLIVGSSLTVKPICNIFKAARGRAEKLIVAPDRLRKPFGFKHYFATADEIVPKIVDRWLSA